MSSFFQYRFKHNLPIMQARSRMGKMLKHMPTFGDAELDGPVPLLL